MIAADVSLRPLSREDLPTVEAWFLDPDTRRFLGGPEWPAVMLARDGRIVSEEFRGATQTGVYRYLAHADGHPFGYVDCGTFDRCTVCRGEGPDGLIITEVIDVVTGSIAFAVDPERRRRGLGRALIGALVRRPELRHVELFEAGVEPENVASRRCLEAAGVSPAIRAAGLRGDAVLPRLARRPGAGRDTFQIGFGLRVVLPACRSPIHQEGRRPS